MSQHNTEDIITPKGFFTLTMFFKTAPPLVGNRNLS